MRIAVWHNLPSGGGKRALYAHVRGLVERGHTVESWCPSTADQTYLPLSDLVAEHIRPLAWEPKFTKYNFAKYLPHRCEVIAQLKALDQHCRECADEIARKDFDVLFANSCKVFRMTPIGRYARIPKVIYLGEPYRLLYEALPELPWVALRGVSDFKWSLKYLKDFIIDQVKMDEYRIQAREELRSARAFDMILANSLFSRENILRCYGLNAHVCYLGIDNQKFVHKGLDRENFVVGLGAFVPEKNIELVIEALSKIKNPRPRLVWIGNEANGCYLDKISKYTRSAGVQLTPKIRIDDDELIDLLNRAMMMVYTSRLEPFGLAPLEANACGTPVITVAEGGLRETIIHGVNGLLVTHDAQSLSTAIQRLINNSLYARLLGENGRKLVIKRWSHAKAIDRLEYWLQETIRKVNPSTLVEKDGSTILVMANGMRITVVPNALQGKVDKVVK